MIYGVILAGGVGKRMGNPDLPKQFLLIDDKPIIIHTLEQFAINNKIEKTIICCPKNWISYTNDLLVKYNLNKFNVVVIEGGESRNDTILCACNYLKANMNIKDEDIILTHDAIRPFITQRILEDSMQIEGYDAIDTVIDAQDTIIESIDKDTISNVPDRKNMFRGQTPQTFRVNDFINLYESLTEEEKNILTDACKIFVIKNKKVKIVKGEDYNVKITTMFDYKIAKAIVEMKLNDSANI